MAHLFRFTVSHYLILLYIYNSQYKWLHWFHSSSCLVPFPFDIELCFISLYKFKFSFFFDFPQLSLCMQMTNFEFYLSAAIFPLILCFLCSSNKIQRIYLWRSYIWECYIAWNLYSQEWIMQSASFRAIWYSTNKFFRWFYRISI